MRYLFLLLILAGCSNTTVTPLARDTIKINTSASEVCGAEGAEAVASRQAAVQTIRRGFDSYVIEDAEARDTIRVTGYTPTIEKRKSNRTRITGGDPIISGKYKQGLVGI